MIARFSVSQFATQAMNNMVTAAAVLALEETMKNAVTTLGLSEFQYVPSPEGQQEVRRNKRIIGFLSLKAEELRDSGARLRALIQEEMSKNGLTITPPKGVMLRKYPKLYAQTKALENVEGELSRIEITILTKSKRIKEIELRSEEYEKKREPKTQMKMTPQVGEDPYTLRRETAQRRRKEQAAQITPEQRQIKTLSTQVDRIDKVLSSRDVPNEVRQSLQVSKKMFNDQIDFIKRKQRGY